MRSWLTASPLLFWQICLSALLAGAWAIKYPEFGAAGLLLIITAAWPFLRQNNGWAAFAGRTGVLCLLFGLGFWLAERSLPASPPPLPESVFDRAGCEVSAVVKEVSRLPQRDAPAGREAGGQGDDAQKTENRAPTTYRLLLTEVRVTPPDAPEIKLPGDLLWTRYIWEDETEGVAAKAPLAGESVRAALRIREVRGFANPGVSDSAERHNLAGVFFRAYSSEDKDRVVFSGAPALGQAARQALYGRFMTSLGDARDPDAPGRAVLPALLFGDRAYLSDAQTDLFAKASLSHSLALSGLHLGFMAALGWFLARFICRLFPGLMLLMPRAKWAVLVAAPLIAAYLWLGGLSPSLLRAALMFACWGIFVFLNRPHPMLDGLFSAVLILFLSDPLIIFDLRLQLSALAVLAIGLALPAASRLAERLIQPASPPRFAHKMEKRVSRPALFFQSEWRAFLRGGFTLLCISAAIQVVLTPLQSYTFNQATPWFILNLLWLPLLSAWVFPLTMLGAALCVIPGLVLPASFALELAARPANWLFNLLGAMDSAQILFAPLVARPCGESILGYAALLAALGLCLRRLDQQRLFPQAGQKSLAGILILFLVGTSCLGLGLGRRYIDEHPPGPRARVLDVGQGLSILLEGQSGRRILIDGGGSPLSAFNVGEYVLIPLLTYNRPPRLDAVINTHPDADHLRGLFPVLQRLDVDEFYLTRPPENPEDDARLTETLAARGISPKRPRPGQKIALDAEDYLKILYPSAEKSGGGNALSLAAQLVHAPTGRGLLLITGDLTVGGQAKIMKLGPALRSDVIQAPHHGSKNALAEGFYELAAPKLVVAGAGYGNQWGFPSKELREALQALHIPLLDTAACGQIILNWGEDGEWLGSECARGGEPSEPLVLSEAKASYIYKAAPGGFPSPNPTLLNP